MESKLAAWLRQPTTIKGLALASAGAAAAAAYYCGAGGVVVAVSGALAAAAPLLGINEASTVPAVLKDAEDVAQAIKTPTAADIAVVATDVVALVTPKTGV